MKAVYADFMKMDCEGRLRLVCIGTKNDLATYTLELCDGMRLALWNDDQDDEGNRDDLLVEGKIGWNADAQEWFAVVDFSSIKNRSQLTNEELERLEGLPICD